MGLGPTMKRCNLEFQTWCILTFDHTRVVCLWCCCCSTLDLLTALLSSWACSWGVLRRTAAAVAFVPAFFAASVTACSGARPGALHQQATQKLSQGVSCRQTGYPWGALSLWTNTLQHAVQQSSYRARKWVTLPACTVKSLEHFQSYAECAIRRCSCSGSGGNFHIIAK